MSTTNYWNQLSGDSQASPWNQGNWAMDRGGPVTHQDAVEYGGNGFMQNMNNDRSKADDRWGSQGFSDAGVGYWSGGRPGAGSWMEQIQAAAAPAAAPTPTPAASPMVPGANTQIPQRTAPVADALSHWDTPYAGRYQVVNQMYDQYLDRDAEDGGWQGWEAQIDQRFREGMNGDQINAWIAQQFQNSPEYMQRMGITPQAAPEPTAPPVTNPWISGGGGGSRKMNRMY